MIRGISAGGLTKDAKAETSQGHAALFYYHRGVGGGAWDERRGLPVIISRTLFNVTATQRAFIEIPRELPGLLCAGVIVWLTAYGDAKSNLIAQICSFAGLLALAILNPSYGVMMIFLFVNSMGIHLSMPLNDSIGMSIAEPGQVGRRIGQYASVKNGDGFFRRADCVFGFPF